ncbi:MAG TPA: lysylphosphatidylglycerol synthase transmembrane domain-containing protein [Acidimicrobiales bacterium]|nr:lysylphosphatidylglycerol synthase transmembrane domain-containing protein [Acidimicrobiales bacterium]
MTDGGETGGPEGARRFLVPALRAAASVLMLGLLVRRVHLSSLLPEWRPHGAVFLGGALAATLCGVVLSALRWQRVLVALELPARLRVLVANYLASLFVGNFLPSTIGGDVLRVGRLSGRNGDAPGTFASVVLERLSGWVVLPVISLIGLFGNPTLLRLGNASRLALAIALGTLALLLALMIATASPRLGGRLAHNEGWLRFMGAVHLGLDRFRRHPGAAVEVLVAGFAYQLVVMLAAFLGAQAIGLDVGWTAILAFMPAVAIAQLIPVTIGGLGVRAGAVLLFLGPLGVGAAQAITFDVLLYGMNLVVSLLGAPAFAVGDRGRGRPTASATA